MIKRNEVLSLTLKFRPTTLLEKWRDMVNTEFILSRQYYLTTFESVLYYRYVETDPNPLNRNNKRYDTKRHTTTNCHHWLNDSRQ